LAKHQGEKTDDGRDEQPGKILHEFRRGELANLKEIPQTPYYGAVDSTPLFLILLGEYANWTGDLTVFHQLRDNVERALRWIDEYGVHVSSGYLAYASKSRRGLGNQGWKDSSNSIMNADGSLASPPIAPVEVQGYVYRAKLLIADLYARAGDHGTSQRLRREAEELKEHFNRDFWLENRQFYALALQKGGRPAAAITSNPGQALWTGIVDDARAPAVVRQLMAEDMFSGWGIRTLSCRERGFNPIGYHIGTVWPHDNSIIATGFRRYGLNCEAATVFDSILHAAEHFEHFRLPEVFAGFSRKESREPVRYPVACHPQAWAAGSIPFMLTSLLGLAPDAFDGRLRIVRPMLPNGVNQLDLHRIKVGDSTIDLHFNRESDKKIAVETTKQTGKINLEIES
jgi:glycogen debranching enzyme